MADKTISWRVLPGSKKRSSRFAISMTVPEKGNRADQIARSILQRKAHPSKHSFTRSVISIRHKSHR